MQYRIRYSAVPIDEGKKTCCDLASFKRGYVDRSVRSRISFTRLVPHFLTLFLLHTPFRIQVTLMERYTAVVMLLRYFLVYDFLSFVTLPTDPLKVESEKGVGSLEQEQKS